MCCLKTNTVLNISPFIISYERLITAHLMLSTVLGLQCLHQKFNLMTLCIISNPVLIGLCKFKGQLQRFHKLSLFDRFRHVENGLDISF